MIKPYLMPDPSRVIYPIPGLVGNCHLLVDQARHEALLLDTGEGEEPCPRLDVVKFG